MTASHGYLPERAIPTGIGRVKVRQPRVADRRNSEEAELCSSKILPPYLRKTRSIEELLPWLYQKTEATALVQVSSRLASPLQI